LILKLKVALKVKMIKNKLGQIVLEEDDLVDILMTDPDKQIKHALVKNIDLTQVSELVDNIHKFVNYEPIDVDMNTFDAVHQGQWHMPDEYKELDIAKWLLEQCKQPHEIQRVGEELLLYQERELFDLLKYIKYLVDTMKDNDIIWGVGRGSSVSSYILYLIGVHRIDSMYYNLDIGEFLR
jgi:DNA polymerase III alpha subunit